MLPGLNHNIPFQGKVYHVQTEDSGRNHPHIITHVFIDGKIIATRKSEYRDRLRDSDLNDVVKTLMQEQHKDVIRDLIHARLPGVSAPAAVAPPKPVVPPLAKSVAPQAKTAMPAAKPLASASPAMGAHQRAAVARPGAADLPRTPVAKAPAPAHPTSRPATPRVATVPVAPRSPAAPVAATAKQAAPVAAAPAPAPPAGSAFGQDLVTGRSLDDVILQFIADEIAKTDKDGKGKP